MNQSKAARRARVTSGKVALQGGIPPNVFLWVLLFLIVSGFLYFRNAMSELEEQRSALMTKQRATAKVLGPKLLPLRDQIEANAALLAGEGKDFVDSNVDWENLLQQPGIYLRMRHEDSLAKEEFRTVAGASLRDGFTSCAIVDPTARVLSAGKECARSTECESGEFCNVFSSCQRPHSPYNMRMLYRALVVLSDKWVEEVREAGTDTALTIYDRGLDSVTRVEIPLAIDLYQRSKFALIVLDEDPKDGLPEAIAGARETKMERVQRSSHFARIGVWDLKSKKLLARMRVSASGVLRDVGTRRAPGGAEAAAARTRTANSCALALEFKSKLAPPTETVQVEPETVETELPKN